VSMSKGYSKTAPDIATWDCGAQLSKGGKRVSEGFTHKIDLNAEWMSISELRSWVVENLTAPIPYRPLKSLA